MKKKHPEHVNLERWLVSYADFITLLFAFFVVMYALSMDNVSKIKAAAESIRKAFGSAGGPAGMIHLEGSAGGSTINPFDSSVSSGGRLHDMPAGKTHTAADQDPELQEMKELLEETVSLDLGMTEKSDRPEMQFDSRGLLVRLAAKDFFEHGQVEVRADLRPILDRLGKVVSQTHRLVRVEGHADRSETKIKGYPSDWELSAARAAWVVKYWMSRFDIEPSHFAVAAYGHFRPLASGDDEWSRAKNRRIEILILNNRYESVPAEPGRPVPGSSVEED